MEDSIEECPKVMYNNLELQEKTLKERRTGRFLFS